MKYAILSDDRDLPLLEFLWHWKVVSGAAIREKFFKNVSYKRAYNRLNALERSGNLLSRMDSRNQRFLWTLTKKGFLAIRDRLPALKEEGFGSEHTYHDFLVSAAHLGEWLVETPKNVRLISEQYLRRVPRELYPSFIPNTDVRRPDGYWVFAKEDNSIRVVALEVEVTPKTNGAYAALGSFYSGLPKVEAVLWIVPSGSTAKRMLTQMKASGRSDRLMNHQFVFISDFIKSGWRADIRLGSYAGKTIANLLGFSGAWKLRGGTVENACSSTHFSLFDPRKCSFNSEISEPSVNSEKAILNHPIA